jgi:mannose-6-phosphate isomerase-like protein (cupin superfamily)
MPIIKSCDAPRFELHGAVFTGGASPSRGARESCVWRVAIAPATPGTEHSVDREEVFVVTAGRAHAVVDGHIHDLASGDILVVPPDTSFSLANPHPEPFEAIVVFPVGGKARLPSGDAFVPPWAA